MRYLIFTLGLFTCLNLSAQKTILIKCGKLLDSKTGLVSEKQNILIKGNQVVSISVNAVSADSTIDLSNYFIVYYMDYFS